MRVSVGTPRAIAREVKIPHQVASGKVTGNIEEEAFGKSVGHHSRFSTS